MEADVPLLRRVPPFGEIYGDAVYLSPRISFVSRGWARGDRSYADLMSGRFATAPGDLPTLVAASAVTPAVASWFRLAGLPLRADCETFANEAEHESCLRAAVGRGLRVASQFPIYEDHWVSPHALNPYELHSFLADKRSISELVPAAIRPSRKVVDAAEFVAGRVAVDVPCAIKVSSRFSATGGHGVHICMTVDELDAARAEFKDAERVVIEEYLSFVATYCFHGAMMEGGRAALLGATEQIIVNRSRYAGGWHGPDVDPPPAAWEAARAVMQQIANTGFRGIVGLDLGILPDGSARAFDINPRVNASTSGLWLKEFRPDIDSRHGRIQAWRSSLTWDEAGAIIKDAIAAGRWIPLSVRDPALDVGPGPGPMMVGVTLADSRQEALVAADELRARLKADIP